MHTRSYVAIELNPEKDISKMMPPSFFFLAREKFSHILIKLNNYYQDKIKDT